MTATKVIVVLNLVRKSQNNLQEDRMMLKNYKSLWLRSLTGLSLVFTLLISSSMVALAVPGNLLSGEIIVSGYDINGTEPSVSLNGENAITGRTFFSSATISTPENSSVTVNLGKLGRVSLSPNSNLSLALTENGITGELSSGRIQVFNSEGIAVNIKTHDSVITNNFSQAGDVTVDLTSGSMVASNETGEAFVNGEPLPAKLSKQGKEGLWFVLAVVGGLSVICAVTCGSDNIVSPRR